MFFFRDDASAFYIAFYRTQISSNGEISGQMQVERGRICRFCKKLLNPPKGKRMPVVSVLNRFKNKALLAASGQESVVLAAEVEKLGNCLHRRMNFPKLSCLSCARQVVRVVLICTVITSCCNESLEKLVASPDQCKSPTSSSKRSTAVRWKRDRIFSLLFRLLSRWQTLSGLDVSTLQPGLSL